MFGLAFCITISQSISVNGSGTQYPSFKSCIGLSFEHATHFSIIHIIHYTLCFAGGFSRCGHPLIILPDNHLFFELLESDLHMLLKYIIQIIPMTKQVRRPLHW